MVQFEHWFHQAVELQLHEPNAMSLATVDETGMPFLRTVLLKYFDAGGFVFFTNYESRKAKQSHRTRASPCCSRGSCWSGRSSCKAAPRRFPPTESLKYFASRPRESQIGAWVSNQSSVISSRKLLMQKLAEIKDKFRHGEIPLPSFWGGYRVMPETIEFWQGGSRAPARSLPLPPAGRGRGRSSGFRHEDVERLSLEDRSV